MTPKAAPRKKKKASKRSGKISSPPTIPNTGMDAGPSDEYVTFIITKLLIGIQPALDPEATFDIVAQMFTSGVDEETIEAYVIMLRSTMSTPSPLVN
jgi:hypothetical protein